MGDGRVNTPSQYAKRKKATDLLLFPDDFCSADPDMLALFRVKTIHHVGFNLASKK